MSAVIYARVPDSLKQALHAHAAERGPTLTAALVELLGQGLEALTQTTSVAELEEQLAVATSERAQTHVQLQEAGLRLQAAREREQTTARGFRALAERTYAQTRTEAAFFRIELVLVDVGQREPSASAPSISMGVLA